MDQLKDLLVSLGLSEKAALVYQVALGSGGGTILELARRAHLPRTTLYYLIDELKQAGALIETRRGKRVFYLAEKPTALYRRIKEKLDDFKTALPTLEKTFTQLANRPKVEFLYGAVGFKQIWEKIFASADREYSIITQAESFLDFVKERYIRDEIVERKKKLAIQSRQIIPDNPYNRKIVARDRQENRQSKFLPGYCRLPFSEIIGENFVAFISPKYGSMHLLIEDSAFARTRQNLFEVLWDSLE